MCHVRMCAVVLESGREGLLRGMYVTVMCWCMYLVCNCEIADVRLLYMCVCRFGCESGYDVCVRICERVRMVSMCFCESESLRESVSVCLGVPVGESVCGVYMRVRVCECTCM